MVQLLVFVYTAEHFSISFDSVTVQDLAFTPTDIALIESLGMRVTQDPQGELAVDNQTVAYLPHVPLYVGINLLTRCCRHKPAIFIGATVDVAIHCLEHATGLFAHLRASGRARVRQALLAHEEQSVMMDIGRADSSLDHSTHRLTKVHVTISESSCEDTHPECTQSCRQDGHGRPITLK